MKTVKLIALIMIAISSTTVAQKQEVNTEKSAVKWTGKKILGSHHGEIKVKEGFLELQNNQITAGKIVMDMQSITDEDLTDESYNQKLVNHLKSDDFFGVEKYPEATFVVSNASAFENGKARVSGKITIKGTTESLSFDVEEKDGVYTAQVNIDRSKFNVRYGSNSFFSNLGDKAIDDIFTLDISLAL